MLAHMAELAGLAITIIGAAWWNGYRIGNLQTIVLEIRDNHLHTINDRISAIEQILMGGK